MEVSLQSEVRGGVSVDQQTGVIGGEMREEEGTGPCVGRTKWLRWISETVEIQNVPSSAP